MNGNDLSVNTLYLEICKRIEQTDEISFKLMGLVPLVSGVAFLGLSLDNDIAPRQATAIAMVSLFSALTTLGLFRWELRNIQTCKWLRERAKSIEARYAKRSKLPKQPNPPLCLGKTEAEKAIYAVTITAWLLIPAFLLDALDGLGAWRVAFQAVGWTIVVLTVISVLWPIRTTDDPSCCCVRHYLNRKASIQDVGART